MGIDIYACGYHRNSCNLNAQHLNIYQICKNKGYAPGLAWVRYNQVSIPIRRHDHQGAIFLLPPGDPTIQHRCSYTIYVDVMQRRKWTTVKATRRIRYTSQAHVLTPTYKTTYPCGWNKTLFSPATILVTRTPKFYLFRSINLIFKRQRTSLSILVTNYFWATKLTVADTNIRNAL
jgi:hypothetical protein